MPFVVVLGFVLLLAVPSVVTARSRDRLVGASGATQGGETGGSVAVEADRGRRVAVLRVCTAVALVAVVQVAAGYELAQGVTALGGSEGSLGWRQVWDAHRLVNGLVALGPALVLGALLAEAVVRRRTDRVRALGYWGNLALVPAGLVGFWLARALAP